jgi:alpha-glucosidase
MVSRNVLAASILTFHSPNDKIAVSLVSNDNVYFYTATYGQDTVLKPSSLGLVLVGNDSLNRFTIASIDSSIIFNEWEPRYGTSSLITDHYRQLRFHLQSIPQQRKFDIEFRLYDDGFAFRYVLPDAAQKIEVLQELTSFNFFRNGSCWWSWADYNTYEKLYQRSPLSEAPHVATPFTVQFDSGTCVSIHEASIDQYTSMTLRKSTSDSLSFNVNLVPWSDGVAVKTTAPLVTPWRVVFIAPNPAQLISSNLLLNLNEPPSGDFTFVKPMRYIGIWWDMHLGLSTWKHEGGRHGATTEKTKAYIDFAASHGIEGVLIEGWNTGWEHWGDKDAFDFTTSYPDFNLEEIARYANTRNVQLIGHHETGGDIIAYEGRMDSAFALYKRLGIHYIKTGYAGPVNPLNEHHHGQYMINHFNKVMRVAAQYGLMLDVHEPVIPSGLSRTYPNLMTFEAVRGMEWNAWSEGNPPSHTCTLPFTRGMAGPIDYTPGIFDINEDNFAARRVPWNGLDKGNNTVHSTLSNQMALMVVNYSPMQMAADLVENYNSHPAFRLLQQIPSTWDESRVIAASIGEYVVVARRRGTTWFIAGITNEYSREISIPLNFLDDAADYSLEACLDAPSSNFTTSPESYVLQSGKVKSTTPFTFWMAPGGGGVIVLRR